MSALLNRARTYYRLGLGNVLAVVWYKICVRSGFFKYRLPITPMPAGPFFTKEVAERGGKCVVRFFSRHDLEVSSPPDWFLNHFNGFCYNNPGLHWSEIPDFIPELGDIKAVWELSRFDWLPRLAWSYRQGETDVLEQLELWLRDWTDKNSVNSGINWKCGQEASFRCLNMLLTALLLDDMFENPTTSFLDFLESHLRRIFLTTGYAKAQQNNHGISEAAALIAAGQYLVLYGSQQQKQVALKWVNNGRQLLESLIAAILLADGSFSQHSLVYHRLIVDVLSFLEFIRTPLRLKQFSQLFYERSALAVEWLDLMIDELSGNGPNLGANDGTYLFNYTEMEYRNFGPSVMLGKAAFPQSKICIREVSHPLVELFARKDNSPLKTSCKHSTLLPKGGYGYLYNGASRCALLRLPVYNFRPSHADALHLDLWSDGINWVRDTGSFSYNADKWSQQFFPGTRSHSTITFDERDQMPRLGRFLFGDWLKPEQICWDSNAAYVKCEYVDFFGARHSREVRSVDHGWVVVDEFSEFREKAVLRWYLAPVNWKLSDNCLSCDQLSIAIESTNEFELTLTHLPESKFYMEKRFIPVFEVVFSTAGQVSTTFILIAPLPDNNL